MKTGQQAMEELIKQVPTSLEENVFRHQLPLKGGSQPRMVLEGGTK
jgi:hypothetical protein